MDPDPTKENPWVFLVSIAVVVGATVSYPDDWSLWRMCLTAVAVSLGWSAFLGFCLAVRAKRRERREP